MANELQLLKDGIMHKTLDVIPYDSFILASAVADITETSPSTTAARLKLLFDNNYVRRAQDETGRYIYTRSKTLEYKYKQVEAPNEEAAVTENRDRSYRPMLAEFLVQHIGESWKVDDISSVSGVPEHEVQKAMSNLTNPKYGYVTLQSDDSYCINESIKAYRPLSVRKRPSTPKKKSHESMSLSGIAEAIGKVESERDEYRETLMMVRNVIDDVLAKYEE